MLKQATFGAGCFWGVEEAFRHLRGVVDGAVGFMGGDVKNPSYKEVCNRETGHAEVFQLEYDDEQVTYSDLLDKFFMIHNPTTLNRQGPDVGSQYRSVIFYHDDDQKELALSKIKNLNEAKKFHKEIVTQVEPVGEFYKAEEYHQRYFEKNGGGACHIF